MSKRDIRLRVENTGEHLTEVVRAALVSANPSAAMKRIAAGFGEAARETFSPQERLQLIKYEEVLYELAKEWAKEEEELYGTD